ncbi:MAG: hypothetical protein Q621_VSBC00460G0003, partial [Veillonella sp. DORA_B_18_19_23]
FNFATEPKDLILIIHLQVNLKINIYYLSQ